MRGRGVATIYTLWGVATTDSTREPSERAWPYRKGCGEEVCPYLTIEI